MQCSPRYHMTLRYYHVTEIFALVSPWKYELQSVGVKEKTDGCICAWLCVCVRACYSSPMGSCDKGYNDSVDVGSDCVGSTLSARIVLAGVCLQNRNQKCRLQAETWPTAPTGRQLSWRGSVNVCSSAPNICTIRIISIEIIILCTLYRCVLFVCVCVYVCVLFVSVFVCVFCSVCLCVCVGFVVCVCVCVWVL
jgi:hypothetical protein